MSAGPKTRDLSVTLDIHEKFKIMLEKGKEGEALREAAKRVQKKKINLPTTDVTVDEEYERTVKAVFQIPTSYVRYNRRMGDEADVTVDYNLEEDDEKWMRSNQYFTHDKEIVRHFTADAFESIINILERHTGFSQEVVPQLHVNQLVVDGLRWSPNLTGKVLPSVYKYWLEKRDLMKKPLCRKYWPQTQATDNNPHLTFRPRDKEKYRLRKQHRKNDLESFRKMQQLRREFGRAQDLCSLVVERESLCVAQLQMQREIFEQSLFDEHQRANRHGKSGGSSQKVDKRRTKPYSYEIKFPKLLIQEAPPPPSDVQERGLGSSMGGVLGQPTLKQQQEADARRAARRQQQANAAAAAQARKPAKKDEEDVAASAASQAGRPIYIGLQPTHLQAVENAALASLHPHLPGPAYVCRPSWAHFMDEEEVMPRDDAVIKPSRTIDEYLRDLEYLPGVGEANRSKIGNDAYSHNSHNSYSNDKEYSGSGTGGENEKGERRKVNIASIYDGDEERNGKDKKDVSNPIITKFRCRARVGRGGRMVVDRVPIYENHEETMKRAYINDPVMADVTVGNLWDINEESDINSSINSSSNSNSNKLGAGLTGIEESQHASSAGGAQNVQNVQNQICTLSTEIDLSKATRQQESHRHHRHRHRVIYPTRLVTYDRPVTGTGTGIAGVPLSVSASSSSSSSSSSTAATLALDVASGGLVPVLDKQQQQKQKQALYFIPPTTPLEIGMASSIFLNHRQEIYACSDSEDEAVVIKTTSHGAAAYAKAMGLGLMRFHTKSI